MTANFTLIVLIGILIASGVYLITERAVSKMLLGVMLVGNGINLLILVMGGPAGNPPLWGRTNGSAQDSDPLAQGMILTAIVITAGLAAFILALAYRSYVLSTREVVENDPEDSKVVTRASENNPTDRPDSDRSDDPRTGDDTAAGDSFGRPTGEAEPIVNIKHDERTIAQTDAEERLRETTDPESGDPADPVRVHDEHSRLQELSAVFADNALADQEAKIASASDTPDTPDAEAAEAAGPGAAAPTVGTPNAQDTPPAPNPNPTPNPIPAPTADGEAGDRDA